MGGKRQVALTLEESNIFSAAMLELSFQQNWAFKYAKYTETTAVEFFCAKKLFFAGEGDAHDDGDRDGRSSL